MKIIIKILKKILFAFSVIYLIDLILSGTNIIIPINICTLSVGYLLGIFGVLAMIIVYIVIK